MIPPRGGHLLALVGTVLVLVLVGAVAVWRAPGGGDAEPDDGGPALPPTEAAPAVTPTAPGTASEGPSAAEEGGILVMWARGGLPSATARRAAALEGVEAVAFVRSGTLGLTGSREADGREVDRLEGGRRIPLSAVAVEPVAWTRVIGVAGGIGDLRPGAVVLSGTGADLRGIGAGGSIDLTTLPGLDVLAVVADEQTRGAEIVLHADDADAAGMRQHGSLVIRHRLPPRAGRDGLVAALEDLGPEAVPDQVVPGELAGYRAPLVLSLPEIKRMFGEFWFRPREGQREIDIDPAFVEANIVTAEVPVLGEVRCHGAIVEDLRAALRAVVDAGLAATIDPSAYAGCYHPRRIDVDRDALSRHSWGIALDVNVDLSLPGLGEPQPPGVIEAFERHGFRWGGDFLHPDNHHFEWVGPQAAVRLPFGRP